MEGCSLPWLHLCFFSKRGRLEPTGSFGILNRKISNRGFLGRWFWFSCQIFRPTQIWVQNGQNWFGLKFWTKYLSVFFWGSLVSNIALDFYCGLDLAAKIQILGPKCAKVTWLENQKQGSKEGFLGLLISNIVKDF